MTLIAPSHPALVPFVSGFWVSATRHDAKQTRELSLPTGQMHLVFRLTGQPLQVFDSAQDATGRVIHGPVIGGARSRYYAKRVDAAVLSIGAQLKPGAAQALFAISAAELACIHTPLADVWGGSANDALQRLADARGQRAQVGQLQTLLLARLRNAHALHPVVADAVEALRQPIEVEQLVRGSGYSHRSFIALFKHATGFSPKRYARVIRFQALLHGLRNAPAAELADLAVRIGYSDQAHMTREFREFAGITPAQYRALAPQAAHHVLFANGSNLFKTRV